MAIVPWDDRREGKCRTLNLFYRGKYDNTPKVYKRVTALTKSMQQMALDAAIDMLSNIWNKYRGCNERDSLGYSSVIHNLILDLSF